MNGVNPGNPVPAIVIALITALWLYPTARMLQLLYRSRRWRRTVATVTGDPPEAFFGRSPRRSVVTFTAPDQRAFTVAVGFPPGTDVTDPPRRGSVMEIVYHPLFPERAEAWHGTGECLARLGMLALIYAVVLFALFSGSHHPARAIDGPPEGAVH